MYVNHGGIGMLADAHGELVALAGQELEPLHLVECFTGKTIALHEASEPWTTARLAQTLAGLAALVSSCAPVDAFLGQVPLGSTEL